MGEYHCKLDNCNKIFSSHQGLWLHSKKFHDNKTYSCKVKNCNFKSAYQSKVRSHTKYLHKNERYKCQRCNYEATTNSDLKRHVLGVHERQKPHPCQLCARRFSQASNARAHLLEKHFKLKRCQQKLSHGIDSSKIRVHAIIEEWSSMEDVKAEKKEIKAIKRNSSKSRKRLIRNSTASN